jgi:predicted metal-dependent HD superfamily phosphohydrolase
MQYLSKFLLTNQKDFIMAWTRLSGTPLGISAKATCNSDDRRRYHNWDHVESLYFHAENTYGMAYDAALDRAIATHDVIWDPYGDLEMRSSLWLSLMTPEEDHTACGMVERTINHEVIPGGDNRIVLLDLADLATPETIVPNRDKLRMEAWLMKGVGGLGFARGNMAFLEHLHDNLGNETLNQLAPWEADAFHAVRDGIETSMDICKREIFEMTSKEQLK